MARAALTVYVPTSSGVQITKTAMAADGFSFVYAGRGDEIHIDNGATAMVITIPTPKTVDGLAVADRTVSVGSNESFVIGDLGKDTYIQTDGTIHVDTDDATDGTIHVTRGK